ncbi:MAG: tRNA (adenosine(37)-N6)-threonylcarbamoyltransferase complex dimerization subunit type 1 TsaB [Dongiaceae bacterium]
MWLVIDTSQAALLVAVGRDGKCIAQHAEAMTRGQAEKLIPVIESLLQDAKIDKSALTEIIAGIGPGSFTGIRLGLAAAEGLALGLKIPIAGVTAMEALHAAGPGEAGVIAIPDGKGGYYAQEFNVEGKSLKPPYRLTAWAGKVLSNSYQPLHLAIAARRNKKFLQTHSPQALYLRQADVTLAAGHG